MTGNDRRRHRAGQSGPWLALLLMLAPSLGGADSPAAIPAGAPAADAAPINAQRIPAPPGNTRIGRIFFSPAERRRRYAEREQPATDAPGTSRVARGERLEVNGAISSSTQGRAVWVNGTAIENSAKLKSAWTELGGKVWLRDERHIPHLVRPGQAIDPASGAIEDLLPPKSVARR